MVGHYESGHWLAFGSGKRRGHSLVVILSAMIGANTSFLNSARLEVETTFLVIRARGRCTYELWLHCS